MAHWEAQVKTVMATKKTAPARQPEQGEGELHFRGFDEHALEFLSRLARNNRREWFAERKPVYEQTLVQPMERLVEDLATALHAADLPLEAPHRAPVQRIYRDTRFSPNKNPFRTHVASVLYRGGDKSRDGVIYLHLDPKGSFVAAGFWQPEKEALRRWRDAIAADPAPLLRISKALPLNTDDTLQRMPRGYERFAEQPGAALLRLKSFVTQQPIEPAELCSRAVLESLAAFARRAEPLLRYGWSLEQRDRSA